MIARWLLIGCGCLLAATLQAATWYVTTNGSDSVIGGGTNWDTALRTISNGVAKASSPDTVLVSNGIYKLAAQIAIAKGITVRSVNGRDVTIVDGNYPTATTRCFVLTHANAIVDGFTITNGVVSSSGGGVYMTAGTVRNCIITGNKVTSDSGGGVYIAGGVLSNCTISCNTNPARSGGGVYFSGGLMQNCLIVSNIADSGGGIFFAGSTTARGCTISANTAVGYRGGGMATANDTGPVVVENCLIQNNVVPNGFGGGAMYATALTTIRNCTIVSNVSTAGSYGGGIVEERTITLQNTIVYYNSGGGASSNYANWGVIWFTNCCTAPLPTWAGNTNNIAVNPMMINMPADCHLLKGSPCINAGTNDYSWMNGAVDLDGRPRVRDGTVDIGAYEYFPKGAVLKFH